MAENGLTLHPEKTRVGDCRQPGEGFEFLGYRFEAGRRDVRKESFESLKDTIREKTRRRRGDSLECVVADLDRTLKGWFGYFKHARPFIFQTLDGFIRRPLRALLRRQEKRRGLGNSLADCRRWPNAFFANAGLFALHTAWHIAAWPTAAPCASSHAATFVARIEVLPGPRRQHRRLDTS